MLLLKPEDKGRPPTSSLAHAAEPALADWSEIDHVSLKMSLKKYLKKLVSSLELRNQRATPFPQLAYNNGISTSCSVLHQQFSPTTALCLRAEKTSAIKNGSIQRLLERGSCRSSTFYAPDNFCICKHTLVIEPNSQKYKQRYAE